MELESTAVRVIDGGGIQTKVLLPSETSEVSSTVGQTYVGCIKVLSGNANNP